MSFATIEEALEDIRAGRPVIVVDGQDRENEGDLTLAASDTTPEWINFMARYGRGLICAPVHQQYFERLNIPLMVHSTANNSKFGTNFGCSVGAAHGVTTGISAADRARTVQVLINPDSKPEDLSRPGHIFPLRARPGGVLVRPGHTEAAVDLAILAGKPPGGVICEILKEDGSMARLPDLQVFAAEHQLKIIHIDDLVTWRCRNDYFVTRVAASRVPTLHGDFRAVVYEDHQGMEHMAMCLGDVTTADLPVRLHSACLTGDVFGSNRCDCGEQLEMAMARIQEHGSGIVLYLAQEGRDIGLGNKIKAYSLQDDGMDTVEANRHLGFPDDARNYYAGAAILKDLKVDSIALMTNNPKKMEELNRCGIKVSRRIPHQVKAREDNHEYLETKKAKLGHWLHQEH